jgi:UDP-N-acetylglucosamine 1-carboxyvinyltransferase
MNAFEIHGGKPLKGEITPQGAKNEALQVLCAALLTDEKVTLTNVPDIVDVNTLIELLQDMGVHIERPSANTVILQANNIDPDYFTTHAFKEIGQTAWHSYAGRATAGSVSQAYIPQPGGDKIGRRRLDTHIRGFERMGVNFVYDTDNQMFSLETDQLKGVKILMEEPSVTGTANLIMAATMAEGTTTIDMLHASHMCSSYAACL